MGPFAVSWAAGRCGSQRRGMGTGGAERGHGPKPRGGPGGWAGRLGEHVGSGAHAGASPADVAAPCSAPPWAPRGQAGLDAGRFLSLSSRVVCGLLVVLTGAVPPALRGLASARHGRAARSLGQCGGRARGHCASAPAPAGAEPRVVLWLALVRSLPRADAGTCPRSVLVAWLWQAGLWQAEPCRLAWGLVLRPPVLL